MYKITVIEDAKELEKLLNPNRSEPDTFPFLKEVTFLIDLMDGSFELRSNDPEFDISKVDTLDFIERVLKNQSVNFKVVGRASG